jgi:hypothetical protein
MKNITVELNTLLVGDANNGHKFPLNLWLNILPMNPLVKVYFGLLFISPFLAFFIQKFLIWQPYYLLGTIAVILFIFLAVQKSLRIPKYIYPLILFCIYYSTWDFFNGRYEQFGIIKLIFKNYSLHTIAILLIIENENINYKFIKVTIKIFKILAILSFIAIIYQFLFNSYFFAPIESQILSGDIDYFRNTSIWGWLSPWGVGLSFLPIMAIIINHDLLEKNLIKSFLWLGVAGIVAFLTNTRWIMINFLLLLFLPIVLMHGSKIKNIIFSIVSSAIVLLILFELFSFSGMNIEKYYNDRIMNKSADTRVLAFKLFSDSFPQNPLFGTGVRVNKELKLALAERSSQIHVGYLSCLYEYGIIGSLILFAFWFLVARKFFRIAKISKQYGIFIGFLCLIFANLTFVTYSVFEVGIIFLFIFTRFYNIEYSLNKIYSSNNHLIS